MISNVHYPVKKGQEIRVWDDQYKGPIYVRATCDSYEDSGEWFFDFRVCALASRPPNYGKAKWDGNFEPGYHGGMWCIVERN